MVMYLKKYVLIMAMGFILVSSHMIHDELQRIDMENNVLPQVDDQK